MKPDYSKLSNRDLALEFKRKLGKDFGVMLEAETDEAFTFQIDYRAINFTITFKKVGFKDFETEKDLDFLEETASVTRYEARDKYKKYVKNKYEETNDFHWLYGEIASIIKEEECGKL